MNFDDFKYNEKGIPREMGKSKLFFENLKNQFYEEVKQADINKDYFGKYNPDSVESFMLSYAQEKASLAQYYKYITEDALQSKDLKHRSQTESMFELILQKKLWDIQLQWRAELISLKKVRAAIDFSFWGQHIQSCPFLPLVTENEVEVMKQFLRDPNYMDKSNAWVWNWQNYDEIMDKDEDGDLASMPEWYEFYDGRMGTGALLLLPDIRGKKEEYYLSLARNEHMKQAQLNPPPPAAPYVAPPPYIFSNLDDLYAYACSFEKDKHFIELFRLNRERYKPQKNYSEIGDFELDEAIQLLKDVGAPVFMQGGCDWRDAIVRCSEQYLCNRVADELDVVYNEYIMFNELGLARSNFDLDIELKFEKDGLSELLIEGIIKGRVLNGEPADLDF